MDNTALKYKDESDRSLGLSGMAIAIYACDGERFLAGIDVDAPSGNGLALTQEFSFDGNPCLSAKLAWKEMIRQYELATAMLIGNAMCRWYVGRGKRLDSTVERAMRSLVDDEGRRTCELDVDETHRLYEKTFMFLERLFTHAVVADTARRFASTLRERRSLSAAEILDLLAPLGH